MDIIAELKAKHINSASTRWNEAVSGIKQLLNYDRKVMYPGYNSDALTEAHDAAVREFTLRMFTVGDSTRFNAFGGIEYGFGIKMDGYGYVSSDPCELMEFTIHFVSHELLDDGTPGIGYYRSTVGDKPRNSNTFVRCGKDHPEAQPYFHRNIDLLREDYPDAEFVWGPGHALEILNFYENKRSEMAETVKAHIEQYGEGHWDQDTYNHYAKLDKDEQALSDLAHALIDIDNG